MRSRTPKERNARFIFGSLPMLLAAFLVLSLIGLFVLTRIGGKAEGARVEMRFQSDCSDLIAPVIQSRVQEMGLGEPSVEVQGQQVLVVATLPGLEDDETAVPALLASSGVFEIYQAETVESRPEGEALAGQEDILNVWYQLSLEGHPVVELELQPNALLRLQGRSKPVLLYTLDGVVIETWDFEEGPDEDTVELQPELLRTEDEVRMAADWVILLRTGPTPCPATVASVTTVTPAP
jgi:hypothetical protein